MQHISDPLSRLHDACAWFARAREVRLLVVRASGDLRSTVVKLLPRYEFHADNFSPWVLLEDAYAPAAPNWQSRAARLIKNWEQRREAFAREGTQLPEAVPRAPQGQSAHAPELDLFFNAGLAVLDALRPPLDGLILVLAPAVVDGLDALDTDLVALVSRADLTACRVVLVLDADVAAPQRTLDALAAAGMTCDCLTDPQQKRRDLNALVAGAGSATPTAGAAPVGITPPRRPNAPPPLDKTLRDAALRKAGMEPAYLDHAPALRRLILGAALAMGDGRHADGIRMQSEAVRLSREVGVPQMMVICQITLASYLSAIGDRSLAFRELDAAICSAAAHGLRDQESQAWLAQGLLHMLEKQPIDAAHAYYRCGTIAEAAQAGVLAIEAWRLAGQAALEGGATEHGVRYLKQALVVAGQLDPSAQQNTSAPEVARRLAKMYSEAGYTAHAQALHAQADAIERNDAPGPELGTTAAGAGASAS